MSTFTKTFNRWLNRILKGHCHHILSYFLIPFYFERNLTKIVSQGIINRILKYNTENKQGRLRLRKIEMDYEWQSWKNWPSISRCSFRDIAPLKRQSCSFCKADKFSLKEGSITAICMLLSTWGEQSFLRSWARCLIGALCWLPARMSQILHPLSKVLKELEARFVRVCPKFSVLSLFEQIMKFKFRFRN